MTETAHFEQRADVLAYIVVDAWVRACWYQKTDYAAGWAIAKGKATLDALGAPTFSDSEWDTFGEMVKTRIEEMR